MDGTATALKEKLDQLLHEAAEVSVALDRVEGTIVGIPHYSVIEARAHELGQQLSRRIQAQQMGELAAHAPPSAKCPECGTRCDTSRKKRQRDLRRRHSDRRRAGRSLPQMPSGLFSPSGRRWALTLAN